jgi:hypothetical protein
MVATLHSHFVSYTTGGIVLVAVTPVIYFFYPAIEWISKKLDSPYKASKTQQVLPCVFVFVLGIGCIIHGG